MIRRITVLFPAAALAACTLPAATVGPVSQLQWFAYTDAQGQRILAAPKAAGEARTKAWQGWLQQHRSAWRQDRQPVTGPTQWCATWLEAQRKQEIGRRGDTLVHFQYGVLRDEAAIQAAQKIWLGY